MRFLERVMVSAAVAVGLLLGFEVGGSAAPAEEPSREQLQQELRQELAREMDADDWFGTSMTLVLLGSDAYPVLLDALQDPNPIVRVNAASALGTMGPSQDGGMKDNVREALQAAMSDPDPRVREQARISLGSLNGGLER